MSEDIDIDNINGICRLCLKEDGTIIPIFGREIINRDCIPLSRKILACVSVEVLDKDSLPKMICVGCVHQIDSWHGFKTVCDKSQEKLNVWLDRQCTDQPSPDVIIGECIDPSSEIVVLDSDDEMEVESNEEMLHENAEPHKEQIIVESVSIVNDDTTVIDDDSVRPCEESREMDHLKISGTCSLSDEDINENGDILHSVDSDVSQMHLETDESGVVLESTKDISDENSEVRLNNSDLNSDEVNGIIESDKILFQNGLSDDSNIDNVVILEKIKVRSDLNVEICEEKEEQNDSELSEIEIIHSVVESLTKAVEKEIDGEKPQLDETNCNEIDEVGDKRNDSLDLNKESNYDPDSTCGNTKFVIQAVTSLATSLAEHEGVMRDSVQSETEMDVDKDKPSESSWQDVSQDDSQGSRQPEPKEPDLIVVNSRYTTNNGPDSEMSGFHIKEEPMSEDEEVMVEEDPLSFSSINIKKEPVDSMDSLPDIKPNILKLNASFEISRYNPQTRKNGKVFCEPCRSTFPNRHKYMRHSESNRHQMNIELFHSGEDPIMAKKKNKFQGLTARYKLRKQIVHTTTIAPRDSGMFQCTMCPSTFTLKRNFLHHIKLKHYEIYINGAQAEASNDDIDSNLFNFSCTKCNNRFASNKSLKLHTAMKHRNQENECTECNQTFPRRNALLSHMRYCGLKSSRHTCTRCSGVFTTTASFLAHKQNCRLPRVIENNQQKQLLACTLCTHSFETTDALITHVRSNHSVQEEYKEKQPVYETKPRPVYENKPRPMFENKTRPIYENKPKPIFENKPKPIEQNQRQAFSEDGILYCKYCTRTFSNHGALSSHLGYHTRKESFECKLCPTITRTMRAFKQHMRKHLAERTECFMCWICYTPFASAEKLRKHKAVHIKLKIYSCNRCDNSYNSLIALTKHKKKFHGIVDLPLEEQIPPPSVPSPPPPHKESPRPEDEIFDELNDSASELSDLPECKICKKKFSTIGNLKRHAVLHVKVKKPIYPPTSSVFSAAGHYRCTNCSKMCGSLAGLRTHYKYCILRGKNVPLGFNQRSLKPKQSVRCDKCKQYFASKACLYKHKYLKRCPLVDRSKTSAFSCMNCKKLFTTLPSLQRHLMHCGDGTERDTSCQFCGLKFSSFIVLSGHMQQCSQNIENNLCTICNVHFANADELRNHTPNCMPERIPSPSLRGALSACTVCNKEFRYSKSMESHVFKNHPEILVDCPICLRKFISQTALNDHQIVCTENQTPHTVETPVKNLTPNPFDARISHTLCYKCSTCGSVFNSLDDLEIHGLSCDNDSSKDTEVKPRVGYNCRTCGKRFSSRSSLYRHKMAKHTGVQQTSNETSPQQTVEETQQPYMCNLCPEISFHKQKGFLEHKEWHNSQDKIKREISKPNRDESQPMLTCELCDEKFANESLYQDHMEEHMNNDEESAFIQTPTSSHNMEMVRCDICSKGFDNKTSLKSHRASHFRVKYSPVSSPVKEMAETPIKKYKVKHVRCNVCDKLLSKNSIAKHRLIHIREDSFDFSTKQNPITPSFIPQENTVPDYESMDETTPITLTESQTVFPCTICNKLFRLRKSLHEHLKLHDEENEYETVTKTEDFDDGASTSSFYECKYCDLTWKHKNNYIRHLSTRRHRELQEQLAGII